MSTEIETTTAAFRYATLVIDYIFDHCDEVKAETLLEYGFPVENPNELIKIFIGNIRGNVSTKVGLSKSAAQDGAALLNAMRCFTLLRSGGRGIESLYLLHYKPTLEHYKEFRERQGQITQRIAPSKWEQTLQEMADLRIRVKALEDEVAILRKVGHILD